MKRVKINGRAKNNSRCMDCGKSLTKDEYNTCTDMCKWCYSKAGEKGYIDSSGNNKINSILENKFRGR